MKRRFVFILVIVPLGVLLGLGLFLTAIELSAGWLNERVQRLFKDIYEA